MSEQDILPTPRMQMARQVFGSGHPVIIIIVLVLLGSCTCWFSLQKISSITQMPTRYVLGVEASTIGCNDVQLTLVGNIDSFSLSTLQFRLLDDSRQPIFVGDCHLKSIILRSNLELEPGSFRGQRELIRVTGMNLHTLAEQDDKDIPIDSSWYQETFVTTVVDGELEVLERPDTTTGPSPTFSMHVDDQLSEANYTRTHVQYEVTFVEGWQPRWYTLLFKVPENEKTYFEILGHQSNQELPAVEKSLLSSTDEGVDPLGDESAISYSNMNIALSFWTDEVSIVQGKTSESGTAESIDGLLRVGIENNDVESRRESGNVRYSAVLGIGIALIVEAFVIVLALWVQFAAVKFGFRKANRSD